MSKKKHKIDTGDIYETTNFRVFGKNKTKNTKNNKRMIAIRNIGKDGKVVYSELVGSEHGKSGVKIKKTTYKKHLIKDTTIVSTKRNDYFLTKPEQKRSGNNAHKKVLYKDDKTLLKTKKFTLNKADKQKIK